jgi:hypothetical protein
MSKLAIAISAKNKIYFSTNERENLMYKITIAYDQSPVHWTKEYSDELEAHTEFSKFVDWGFADEYSTVNLYTPSGKCYTKLFYREGRRVVVK